MPIRTWIFVVAAAVIIFVPAIWIG